MSRIKTTHKFEGESYYCNECGKDLSRNDIQDWRCTQCKERVRIEAGLMQPIMRKSPEDVTKRDVFVMKGTGEFHEIYKVEEKKGKYFYNLKDYGRYKQSPNDWVNCMYSSYE